jgi:alpha-L-rhamnosidase
MFRPFAPLFASFLLASASLAQPAAPQGLLVDLLRRPDLTVITDPHPRFSWIVNDPARGAVQSAFEISVSTTSDGRGDLWGSGKIMSAQSIAVPYSGKALEPNHSYWWAVRTWNGQGEPSPWSERQRFNTGEFNAKQAWPGESHWAQIDWPQGGRHWVTENREPIEYHPIAPVAARKTADGTYFIDFGRAAFATLRLTLTSPEDGREIEVRLGEKRVGDAVDTRPGGSIYYGSHTLAIKKGTHTYDLVLPRHVSKMPHSLVLPRQMPEVEPYRYAQIIGSPSEIKPDDVRQVALFYFFDDDASAFSSSDPGLNAVWGLCKYTMKATSFMGIYIDGVRERMPYEADALIQTLGHYCVDREYAIARYSGQFLFYHATWPTEWVMQSVLLAYADYLNTGDAASIARNYETLKAKTLSALERPDGLISTRTGKMTPAFLKSVHYQGKALRDVVDWPQPSETDGYQFANYNTVVNAYHYRALVLMARIAEATGHKGDAEAFDKHAAGVRAAFEKAFFDPARGIYVDGEGATHASLHANAFPLAFGLVPPDREPKVVAFLETRDMNCGPYGAQFLVEGLYDAGAAQAGLSLLTNKTDRGWLNMIRSGSTITTEAWDAKYKKNLTWNHAWGAAPANLIPRKLMGVEPLEPGFGRMRIDPQPAALTSASLKMPTIRGTVRVDFRRDGQTIRLDVTIPANTRAEVHVPNADPATVRESGVAPDTEPGIRRIAPAVYEIGSGAYHFTATARGQIAVPAFQHK